MVGSVDEGVYVVSTRNVGGINPVSGDYSVGASGRRIVNGELAKPVSGVTLAAPILKLLANVRKVGADVRWVSGAGGYVGAPSCRGRHHHRRAVGARRAPRDGPLPARLVRPYHSPPVMPSATLAISLQDAGRLALLLAAGLLTLTLDLRVLGFAVVVAGFGWPGWAGIDHRAGRTRLDRL